LTYVRNVSNGQFSNSDITKHPLFGEMTPSTDAEDFSIPEEGESEAINIRGIKFSSNSLVENKGKVRNSNIKDFLSDNGNRLYKCKTGRVPGEKKSSLLERLTKWKSATSHDPLKITQLNTKLLRNYGFEALIEEFEPDSATEKIAQEKYDSPTNMNICRAVPIRTQRLKEISFMNCNINFKVRLA
jgi:hypothetical protein